MNIWDGSWVVREERRFITSSKVDDIKKVSDIIDPLWMDWNLELISLHFNECDPQRILLITLSGRAHNDSLTWAYSK